VGVGDRDVHRGCTSAAAAPRRKMKNCNRAATVIKKSEPRRCRGGDFGNL